MALLTPVQWPEPFGLVMTEAMACGTPVIGYARGSVPELVEQGITGFIVSGIQEAVEAVNTVSSLSRQSCRDHFERRFSSARMCKDYVGVYSRLLTANNDQSLLSVPDQVVDETELSSRYPTRLLLG